MSTSTNDTVMNDPSLLSDFSILPPAAAEGTAIPGDRLELRIVQSLRRIIRAVDLFSHQLASRYKITAPQLMCLIKVAEDDGITVSALSQAIFLSSSTVVGILDRLERRGLLVRERSTNDRRQVLIHATRAGRDLIAAAPSPLQDALAEGLAELPLERQQAIITAIDSLVGILEIKHINAAPVLGTGALMASSDENTPPTAG